MGYDNSVYSQGPIVSDGGNFSTDGRSGNVTTTGTITATGAIKGGVIQANQASGTVQTLSTGNTVTVAANTSSVRVTAAGAVTGIILPAGTLAGQRLTVIHEGAAANTLTMAAAGTSNVANGVSCVITGPSARTFEWDGVTALWYQCT